MILGAPRSFWKVEILVKSTTSSGGSFFKKVIAILAVLAEGYLLST
jgi:hypothetical protein